MVTIVPMPSDQSMPPSGCPARFGSTSPAMASEAPIVCTGMSITRQIFKCRPCAQDVNGLKNGLSLRAATFRVGYGCRSEYLCRSKMLGSRSSERIIFIEWRTEQQTHITPTGGSRSKRSGGLPRPQLYSPTRGLARLLEPPSRSRIHEQQFAILPLILV